MDNRIYNQAKNQKNMDQNSLFLLSILLNQSNSSKSSCVNHLIKLVDELQNILGNDELFEAHKQVASLINVKLNKLNIKYSYISQDSTLYGIN